MDATRGAYLRRLSKSGNRFDLSVSDKSPSHSASTLARPPSPKLLVYHGQTGSDSKTGNDRTRSPLLDQDHYAHCVSGAYLYADVGRLGIFKHH